MVAVPRALQQPAVGIALEPLPLGWAKGREAGRGQEGGEPGSRPVSGQWPALPASVLAQSPADLEQGCLQSPHGTWLGQGRGHGMEEAAKTGGPWWEGTLMVPLGL